MSRACLWLACLLTACGGTTETSAAATGGASGADTGGTGGAGVAFDCSTIHLVDRNLDNRVRLELGASGDDPNGPGNDPILPERAAELTQIFVEDVATLEGLECFTNLEDLALLNGTVSDLGPLANLKRLRVLSISNHPIADLSPLAGLPVLDTIALDNVPLADLSPLANVKTLTALGVSRSNVADVSPLSGLSNLEALNLNDTQVASLEPLHSLTHLQSLTVDRTHVTDLSPIGDAPAADYECATVITAYGVALSNQGQQSVTELCARGWSVVAQLPGATEKLGCHLSCFEPLPPG